jgi:hypothetical protein
MRELRKLRNEDQVAGVPDGPCCWNVRRDRTREELQRNCKRNSGRADTFVDFEQGMNNAMKRLQAALDDNAAPRFIEADRTWEYICWLASSGRWSFR